jgi:hypothetical protein
VLSEFWSGSWQIAILLKMRMDDGPEQVSLALVQWAEEHGV